MSNRIIHTNLYSDKSFELINNLIHAVQHVRTGKIARSINDSRFTIERAPDGEITFIIHDVDSWYFYRNVFYKRQTDKLACDWLAYIFKDTVKRYLSDAKTDWQRLNNNDVIIRTGYDDNSLRYVKISDVYCLYDILKNRKNIENKYPDNKVSEFRGEQRDPIATELEIARREEIKRIEEKYRTMRKDVDNARYERRTRADEQIRAWYDDEIKRLKKEQTDELKALEMQLV